MASVNINFKIDEDLKNSLEVVCDEMGISMSIAFTIFAKMLVRERKIPFKIKEDIKEQYNNKYIRMLNNSLEQLNNGEVVIKSLNELERMADEL